MSFIEKFWINARVEVDIYSICYFASFSNSTLIYEKKPCGIVIILLLHAFIMFLDLKQSKHGTVFSLIGSLFITMQELCPSYKSSCVTFPST